ncbi:hypothetical protein ACLOJK_011270 [Asimina triloba]
MTELEAELQRISKAKGVDTFKGEASGSVPNDIWDLILEEYLSSARYLASVPCRHAMLDLLKNDFAVGFILQLVLQNLRNAGAMIGMQLVYDFHVCPKFILLMRFVIWALLLDHRATQSYYRSLLICLPPAEIVDWVEDDGLAIDLAGRLNAIKGTSYWVAFIMSSAADLGLVISVGDVGISLETMGDVVGRLPGWRCCLLPLLSSSDLHGCRRLISMALAIGYQICYLRGLAFSLVGTDLLSSHSPAMGCAGSLSGKMMKHRIRCSDSAL